MRIVILSKENQLTILHQDGDVTFDLIKGGYCLENGSLTISIETERADKEGFPDCALFCISDHPVSGALKPGDSFTGENCDTGIDISRTASAEAFAYFEFHALNVHTIWTVVSIDKDDIRFSLLARHDDVDYYDQRAKPTPTRGEFTLSPRLRSELWNPC